MGTRRRSAGRCGAVRNGGNFRRYAQRHGKRKRAQESAPDTRHAHNNHLSVAGYRMACRHACEYGSHHSRAVVSLRLDGVHLRHTGVFYCAHGVYYRLAAQHAVVHQRIRAYMDGDSIGISIAQVYPQYGAVVRVGRAVGVYGGAVVFPSVCKKALTFS